jgi:ABC-type transporter Mla subunit MlaD
MAQTSAEVRQELLDAVAAAADEIGIALESLGEAYEHLDEQTADRLEEELFRPVQLAYGRAQRTHTEFAARHELPSRAFEPARSGAPSRRVNDLIAAAADAADRADGILATLQDSMVPVEYGDAELRGGLGEVRRLLGDVRRRARELTRTVGR